jgi:lipopolysaccharide export system protein LptC
LNQHGRPDPQMRAAAPAGEQMRGQMHGQMHGQGSGREPLRNTDFAAEAEAALGEFLANRLEADLAQAVASPPVRPVAHARPVQAAQQLPPRAAAAPQRQAATVAQPRPRAAQPQIADPRKAAEFRRAQRHSRMVRALKFGLPVFGAVTVIVMAGAFLVTGMAKNGAEFGSLAIEDGKLVMNNPELNGLDSNKRPFHVSAKKAVQDAESPSVVALEEIQAKIAVNDKSFAAVTAGGGLYDAEAKKLSLDRDVAVDTDDGTTIRMEDAAIDIDKGDLVTDRPVTVDTGRTKVSSDSMQVLENGKKIIFERNVRMTIQPEEAATAADGKQGDSAPAPVAVSARDPAVTDAKKGSADQ